MAVNEHLQDEDHDISKSVQRGLGSRAYGAGRLSVRRDAGENLFHKLRAKELRRADADADGTACGAVMSALAKMFVLLAGFALASTTNACATAKAPSADNPDAGPLLFVEGSPADPLDDVDAAIGARARLLFGSARCSGGPEQKCHGDGAGGMWLRFDDTGGDGGDVIGVPSTERPELWRVRPFDPEHSYLMLKVSGDAGIDGDVMPLGNGPDPRIVSLVRGWIEAGAPIR